MTAHVYAKSLMAAAVAMDLGSDITVDLVTRDEYEPGTFSMGTLRLTTVIKKHWHRSPCHVLGEGLRLLMGDMSTRACHDWCEFTPRGMAWVAQQRLIYPQLARDTSLLWSSQATVPPLLPHGRPARDWATLDEWTRIEAQSDVTRGDVGEYGKEAQVAGLYWDMAQDMDTLFDVSWAVGIVASAAARV